MSFNPNDPQTAKAIAVAESITATEIQLKHQHHQRNNGDAGRVASPEEQQQAKQESH